MPNFTPEYFPLNRENGQHCELGTAVIRYVLPDNDSYARYLNGKKQICMNPDIISCNMGGKCVSQCYCCNMVLLSRGINLSKMKKIVQYTVRTPRYLTDCIVIT